MAQSNRPSEEELARFARHGINPAYGGVPLPTSQRAAAAVLAEVERLRTARDEARQALTGASDGGERGHPPYPVPAEVELKYLRAEKSRLLGELDDLRDELRRYTRPSDSSALVIDTGASDGE